MDKPGGGRQGHSLSRRKFLTVAGSAGVAVAATQFPFAKARSAPARFTGYPFTLGVASGDPTSDGVVLWTRLAPSPLAGNGGMPDKAIPVQWEVAKDENFTHVVAGGEELAAATATRTRCTSSRRACSPASSTSTASRPAARSARSAARKTAPAGATSALALRLRVAASSTSTATTRPTSTWSQEDLDLVIHLGDYIYEYDATRTRRPAATSRGNSDHEIVNLADYRERHAQYKTDPDLQAAHAAFAVAGDVRRPRGRQQLGRRHPGGGDAAGHLRAPPRGPRFQAYWEHMPLRKARAPVGQRDPDLTAARSYGDLATFHVMDTRQFRSDQACGDGNRAGCDDRSNPARTITGAAQEQWLYDGLQQSPAKWQILAQQVFMAQMDNTNGAGERYNMDAWDGYKVSRDKLLDFIDTRAIANPIVITGDVHQNWAADLLRDFRDPASKILGSEFIGTSISTTGDGSDTSNAARLTENPWIKFNNQQRGYVKVSLDQQACKTDYKVVPYVKRPGAPISIKKSFVVEAGNPGLKDA